MTCISLTSVVQCFKQKNISIMENLKRGFPKGLLLFIAIFGLYILAGAVRNSHKEKAVILKFPTPVEMTDTEKGDYEFLFDGDTLVRILLIHENSITHAIYTSCSRAKHGPLGKIGDTLTVNKFFNNEKYIVEK